MKAEGSVATDIIRVSDLTDVLSEDNYPIEFNVFVPDVFDGEVGEFSQNIAVLDLADFAFNSPENGVEHLRDYLQQRTDDITFDVTIHDDTRVDFFGFSFCQKPLKRRGATMSVDSRGFGKNGVNFIQCLWDPTQMPCDPNRGDTVCTAAVPLGCYKEGNRQKPPLDNEYYAASYVGGEVRVTEPIIGESLTSLAEADAVCAASFGQDWRTLSFHEAGGSIVISHTQVPEMTRMWVDIKDKPVASCWRNGPNNIDD